MLLPKEAYVKLGGSRIAAYACGRTVVCENLDVPRVSVSSLGGSTVVRRKGLVMEMADRVMSPSLSLPFSLTPPEGVTYEVGIFDSARPLICEYAEVPTSKMVLVSRTQNGRKEYGSPLVEDALRLGVDPPPVLIDSPLPMEEARRLSGFIRDSLSSAVSPSGLLESIGLKPILRMAGGSPSGGLVLCIGKDTPMFIRVNDPALVEARMGELRSRESLDIYGIILSDFSVFCETVEPPIPSEGGSLDQRFLRAVEGLYRGYVKSRGKMVDDCHISDEDFPLDESLLSEETVATFESFQNGRKVLRMILSALHTPKKRPTGTLTESVLVALSRVRESILKKAREGYTLPAFPTFKEYLMSK